MELLRHDGVDGAEPRSEPADLAGNDGDDLVGAAVELAERLLAEAGRLESRAQRRRQARLGALVEDRDAKRFAFLLTDRVLRPADRAVGARQLAKLVAKRGAPRAFPLLDRLGLRLAAAAAPKAPGLVMPLVVARLRRESDPVILDARPDRLARHLARRRRQGISGNVNVLGEAILGDAEADRRRAAMLAQLADPAVDYVSVKLSAIAANLSVVAFDATVERLAERLAPLYRAAAVTTPPKFVNLDMEEYRDLWLTVGVFRALLERPEFERLPAGIVLQAYLPDSFTALVELTEWAQARVAAGGAPVKVRIVKGANLAMEAVEAEQHGWTPAPFATKAEVDANYKKMLDWALTPERAAAVRIGAASHNLYDLAWALLLAEARGVSERVDAEMLEGMAPGQSLAVARRARRLLAYTPIADRADFASAVAYLTRRLDENTAPENFLAALHRLAADPAALAEQRQRFEAAVRDRLTLSAEPRRRQDRRAASPPTTSGEPGPFVNEPDTDFTLPANRAWLAAELAAPRDAALPDELTTLADIDEAVARARAAAARWRAAPAGARRTLLLAAADELARARGEALAVMQREAGKVVAEADPEVSEAVDFARYYAEQAAALETLQAQGLVFDPFGVVVVTPPWNFPFAIPAGGVLAALAAGNAVILKPSPQTPRTALVLARALWRAGAPSDLVQFVRCPENEVGRRLITHPDVGAVILTGAHATAQLFRSWKPDLALHAETSGKNSFVITASADLDLAVRDLVRSAFGHAGQKCSAASLAVVERSVYDSAAFRRQLTDAVASLPVGPAEDLTSVVGPLIGPPGPDLERALTTLDPGEEWLVAPRRLDEEGRLWRPGVKLGVAAGSFFHQTECFGPVLGVIPAASLEEAVAVQNAVPFGLTGGIASLDDEEVAWWLEHVEVGNAYVNRHTTGAIVARQPFGGWKRSAVGPGVKAGGPNYVLSLGVWRDAAPSGPAEAEASYRRWQRDEFAAEHDPSGLRSERNVLRYRPLPHGVLVRAGAEPDGLANALVAARAMGVRVVVSAPAPAPTAGAPLVVETDEQLAARLAAGQLDGFDRIRGVGPGAVSDAVRRAAHAAGLEVFDQPVVAHGRIELLRWVREQAVSETRHRYGNPLD